MDMVGCCTFCNSPNLEKGCRDRVERKDKTQLDLVLARPGALDAINHRDHDRRMASRVIEDMADVLFNFFF